MSAPAPSMYSDKAKEIAEELNLKLGKPNLEVFSNTLQQLAEADTNILVVTSDSRGSGKLVPFAEKYPNQIIEVGIAEQNLVGVAAGLASANKTVFAVSPACFLSARSFEQIKNDVAYSDNPVTLVGISAGVSYGALGSTHHSLHDIAALRAVNNMSIIVPADNYEATEAVNACANSSSPTYLRFGKAPLYDLPNQNSFEIGKSRLIQEGSEIAFIATGETAIHALLASKALNTLHGIQCRVISMPSIKPLDSDTVLKAATDCSLVITVEEHMTSGGLGEACASIIAQSDLKPRFRIIAIPDEYTVTGSQSDIFRHYGISMENLVETVLSLV